MHINAVKENTSSLGIWNPSVEVGITINDAAATPTKNGRAMRFSRRGIVLRHKMQYNNEIAAHNRAHSHIHPFPFCSHGSKTQTHKEIYSQNEAL